MATGSSAVSFRTGTISNPGILIRRSLAACFANKEERIAREQLKRDNSSNEKTTAAHSWKRLGVDISELSLALTLPTGQSFRWKLTGKDEYTGVVDKYLFTLRQTSTDVEYMLHYTCASEECCNISYGHHCSSYVSPTDEVNASVTAHPELLPNNASTARSVNTKQSIFTSSYGQSAGQHRENAIHLCQMHGAQSCCICLSCAEVSLKDYFNLDKSLEKLWAPFIAADKRFAALAPYMKGARLLRQHPLECLFQFICSSNNHIQRITQMVDYLASHGTFLGSVSGIPFHAFPTLEALAKITEGELRKAGFGYRAKYIVGTVKELQMKEGGGQRWLNSLRSNTLEDTYKQLCSLPGIGPKVAACIALFSLDQHHAIPVDTHVWQVRNT
ncbi:hypothetical protein KP509_32G039900 [Ceratopteris richardii]|uniref:DNA-(apurinic or apyrimidinic site) lyase n=1 Tax=Ceratopteris richardii TaxID=49495 RepID=A0A8T2QUS8_CERRI|nr:hypothetical protein KP509_32G039900 [Ceratopteris richardii]